MARPGRWITASEATAMADAVRAGYGLRDIALLAGVPRSAARKHLMDEELWPVRGRGEWATRHLSEVERKTLGDAMRFKEHVRYCEDDHPARLLAIRRYSQERADRIEAAMFGDDWRERNPSREDAPERFEPERRQG
jgi:hypothetical protein